MKTTIQMDKKQALQDLKSLQSKFKSAMRYYPLKDKELMESNAEIMFADLVEYITEKL